MMFGGLLRHSLIDYPDRLACVLFTRGCNFTCPYCHNPDLVASGGDPARDLTEEQALAFLEDREGFLEGVVISGGEPTLQPALPAFCRKVRRMGYAVKLDTNGSRPRVLERLIREGLVDFVAMDLKTAVEGYGPPLCPRPLTREIGASVAAILASGLPHEFRTTCVHPLVTPETLLSMARTIRGAQRLALQRCRGEKVLDPGFFRREGRRLEEEPIRRLRDIAAPWVRRCVLR
jgi:pyruvate formate lyase activating enzyme